MHKKMLAANRTDKASLTSLRNACRLWTALLLVFAVLAAVPTPAERPDILWMAGGHAWHVTSVTFSPDGSMVASGSWDKTIKLWRLSDGALLRTLEGHTSGV